MSVMLSTTLLSLGFFGCTRDYEYIFKNLCLEDAYQKKLCVDDLNWALLSLFASLDWELFFVQKVF